MQRRQICVVVACLLSFSAAAMAHTSVGSSSGGGSSSDPNADCLRWEAVVASPDANSRARPVPPAGNHAEE